MKKRYLKLLQEKKTTNSLFWSKEYELLALSLAISGYQLKIPFPETVMSLKADLAIDKFIWS